MDLAARTRRPFLIAAAVLAAVRVCYGGVRLQQESMMVSSRENSLNEKGNQAIRIQWQTQPGEITPHDDAWSAEALADTFKNAAAAAVTFAEPASAIVPVGMACRTNTRNPTRRTWR